MVEKWKRVVLDGRKFPYYVSNKSRVKNFKKVILKQHKRGQRKGVYLYVTLHDKGFKKRIDMQRLVAFHFKDNPLNKPEVNHLDGNQFNNWAPNLEWCTRSENELHKRFLMAHREFVDDPEPEDISEEEERRQYEEQIGATSAADIEVAM